MTAEELALEVAIHNERTKLFASGVNIAAAGCVVTGIIGPFTTVGMRIAPTATIGSQELGLMLAWFGGAIILHVIGSFVLGELQ